MDQNEVRYIVVGGYALGYHGYVRATGDLDIFIEVSEDNAKRLASAFVAFGFVRGVTKELFLEEGKIIRVGRPPMRLEILTEISGVTFEECYRKREQVKMDDFQIFFIDLESLVKNKQATGRSKDRVDVENLKGKDNASQLRRRQASE